MSEVTPISQNDFVAVLSEHEKVVVKFGAPWCAPCKALDPVLEKIAGEYPNIHVVSINIDEAPALAAKLAVRSVPTMMGWNEGTMQWTELGAIPAAKIRQAFEKLGG